MKHIQAKAESMPCVRLPKDANTEREVTREPLARQAKLEKVRRKLVMEDVKGQMEAQTEEAAQLKMARPAVGKTGSGNMRGAIQALTGEGVPEGDKKTEKENRNLVMEEPAPCDTNFAEEMTKASKTLKDRGAIKITVSVVTTRLRASNMSAAPGLSGSRNSHIAMIAEGEGGAGWMRLWIQLWVQGDITTNVAGPVEARIAGTAAQTSRKVEADSVDGGIGEAGRRGHDRRCLQEALQHIPRTAVFSSDHRKCGGCDWCAETNKHGGPKRRSGGHRSQQRVWKHVETLCAVSRAETLPTDAGNIPHAVGKLKYHSKTANSGRVHRVERGARHVARCACCQPHFFVSRSTKRWWKQGRKPRMDKTTRREGRLVNSRCLK